ncbi:hypothetical protein SAMN04489723_1181, partial [Algoriphagus aquimarinus]
ITSVRLKYEFLREVEKNLIRGDFWVKLECKPTRLEIGPFGWLSGDFPGALYPGY